MKLRLFSEAYQEFRDAARWYDEQQPGLGRRFAHTVIEELRRVREHPDRFAVYEGKQLDVEYRRALVPGFPYLIIYRIEQDVIVVSIQHTSRAPGYWENR